MSIVADGKGGGLNSPKRKEAQACPECSLERDSRVAEKIRSGDKVLNSELRRELAAYGQKSTVKTKGVN